MRSFVRSYTRSHADSYADSYASSYTSSYPDSAGSGSGRASRRPARRGARAALAQRLEEPVTVAACAYLAGVSLICAIMWGLGDRWWPATVLLFIGRWVFLTPLVLLVPLAVMARRVAIAPLLLGAAIALIPLMGFRASVQALIPRANGIMHLRVVTLNAEGGDEISGDLPALLTEWKPDVIALQECGEFLAEATRHIPGWYHHDVRQLCLLSRYPIRAVHVMDRTALERVHEDERANVGGSGDIARYVLQTPGGVIEISNLHLETPRKGLEELLGSLNMQRLKLNTQLRDIESDLARRWVGQGPVPMLVVGDFNTPVESRIFREHWGDLEDAFSSAGFGLGMTKYNGWIRVRIDHVLMGPTWRADHIGIGRDVGSDHRPVIADLTLVARR